MSLLAKSFGLLLYGILSLLWVILEILASIVVAVTIVNMYGFTGYVWWAFVIVVFAVICKILFYNKNINSYEEMVDDYNKELSEFDE